MLALQKFAGNHSADNQGKLSMLDATRAEFLEVPKARVAPTFQLVVARAEVDFGLLLHND